MTKKSVKKEQLGNQSVIIVLTSWSLDSCWCKSLVKSSYLSINPFSHLYVYISESHVLLDFESGCKSFCTWHWSGAKWLVTFKIIEEWQSSSSSSSSYRYHTVHCLVYHVSLPRHQVSILNSNFGKIPADVRNILTAIFDPLLKLSTLFCGY